MPTRAGAEWENSGREDIGNIRLVFAFVAYSKAHIQQKSSGGLRGDIFPNCSPIRISHRVSKLNKTEELFVILHLTQDQQVSYYLCVDSLSSDYVLSEIKVEVSRMVGPDLEDVPKPSLRRQAQLVVLRCAIQLRGISQFFWGHRLFHNFFQLPVALLYWYWCYHLPAPGKAVLALTVVAVIMTLVEMTAGHKTLWLLLVFCLVSLENKSINQDRANYAHEQSEARKQEQKEFKAIASRLESVISQNESAFDATMKGIKSTLETSERTLQNTRPYASLRYIRMDLYLPDGQNQVLWPLQNQLRFNVYFMNGGNDNGRNVFYDVKFYAGKPDDIPTEKSLSDKFEAWWHTAKHRHREGREYRPGGTPFFDSFNTDFTPDELASISSGEMTIYTLMRITFSDKTGNWAEDVCFGMQNPLHDFTVGHDCKYHNKSRYALKPPSSRR